MTYTQFFGPNIENDKTKEIRKIVIRTFRKPLIKTDINTHGPLWNQYRNPQGAIDIYDLDLDKSTPGYVLVEGKGKNMCVFASTLNDYLSYLENRGDGLFPATYFVDHDFTISLGENGECGAMRPIYVYRGVGTIGKEKLIKFPVPDWNRVIDSDLDSKSYCLCYQYHVDTKGFGPYGFNTDHAQTLIKNGFPNLTYFDQMQLKQVDNIQKSGLYFYGDKEKLDSISAELRTYNLAKRKNELRSKRLLPPSHLPSKPILLNLTDPNKYESKVIKKMLSSGYNIVICNYYMPEAWQTLILFEEGILSRLKEEAPRYGIQFVEVSSINKLNAW